MRRSAVDFFQLAKFRDPHVQAARLCEQFVAQNAHLLKTLDVVARTEYDGRDVRIRLDAGSAVGAIPLFSPTSAALDYGLVVQPRFPWAGIGPMLAAMGWRIAPKPLRLPLLRRSERRVPPWVLSSMILGRLKALLDKMNPRFEMVQQIKNAPRGRVDWTAYATRNLSGGQFLRVPCSFPDLHVDRQLASAIRFALERQKHSLESQTTHGSFVHRLIEACNGLLLRLQGFPALAPKPNVIASWMRRPLSSEYFSDGVQAIEWTIEERGLAGLSDLGGIPWTMPMEQFFEAWAEVIFRSVAQRTGAAVRIGRSRETTVPISWEPPYEGSQKSLMPDIRLEWESTTLIADAKYKRHWEELQELGWARVDESLREQHRADLLQVLAYANLARTPQVIVCLVYPCSSETWFRLRDSGRLLHRAEISAGSRQLQIWLTAIPISAEVSQIAQPLVKACRDEFCG